MFSGNPAGVCLVENHLEEDLMQKIAAENNLAETAFVKKNGNAYDLRWFTPTVEIDLCGHATLASAFVIHNGNQNIKEILFHTRSGELRVSVKKNLKDLEDVYEMDFPAWEVEPAEITELMTNAIGGLEIAEAYTARDLILLLNSEEDVKKVTPNIELIRTIPNLGVVVTAKGNKFDFVSRCFAPNAGIPEDPVTGSTHSALIPLWAKRLNKNILTARQLSQRGGNLFCEYRGERVVIAGSAKLYMSGEIHVNSP
jgi:PhzF family phenazine biosynthesis protein